MVWTEISRIDCNGRMSRLSHMSLLYTFSLLDNLEIISVSFFQILKAPFLICVLGDSWKTQRRVLQPTFHLSVLETFVGTFADSAKALVQRLACVPPGPRNIAPEVNQCVIDILNGNRTLRNNFVKCSYIYGQVLWRGHWLAMAVIGWDPWDQ